MANKRSLPVRECVSASYATVAKAPGRFLGLAMVPLIGLVVLVYAVFQTAEPVSRGAFYLVYVVFAGYLAQYALFILTLGALSLGAVRVDRQRPFGVTRVVVDSLTRLPALLGATPYVFVMGTSLFYGLFSTNAHIEYALPALVLALLASIILAPVPAVCMIERRGPFASMARAARLTRGNRWRLLAGAVIILVPIVGLDVLLVSVIASFLINTIVAALAFLTATAVLAAFTAVAYDRLVPPENEAAAVFD